MEKGTRASTLENNKPNCSSHQASFHTFHSFKWHSEEEKRFSNLFTALNQLLLIPVLPWRILMLGSVMLRTMGTLLMMLSRSVVSRTMGSLLVLVMVVVVGSLRASLPIVWWAGGVVTLLVMISGTLVGFSICGIRVACGICWPKIGRRGAGVVCGPPFVLTQQYVSIQITQFYEPGAQFEQGHGGHCEAGCQDSQGSCCCCQQSVIFCPTGRYLSLQILGKYYFTLNQTRSWLHF